MRTKIKLNKEWIVDGIDIGNFYSNTPKEILAAEAKNHSSEIQYMIGINVIHVYEKEIKTFRKKLKKEYGDDLLKIEEEIDDFVDKHSIEWLKKAADQNYAPAQYELYKIYENKIYDNKDTERSKNEASKFFKLAIEQHHHLAVKDYIRLKRENELPAGFPDYDEQELIQKICEKGDFIWKDEYETFERKDTFENIRKINAHLYKMMFNAYDNVRELKALVDSFIKQGKSYYKNYEIRCGIGFYPEEEYKLKDGTTFEDADCEWELISTYKKKLPEKMKALDLWNNYHFGPFEDLTHDYVCKAMYLFAEPKVEKENYSCHKIPWEILQQAKPEDFGLSVSITLGHNKLIKKFSREEWESWRENNSSRKYHLPSFWNVGFLRSWRILSQAKALLQIELDSADISKQIKMDFESFYKESESIFSTPILDMKLSYDYRRPFGIKTKIDSLVENEIQIMCGLEGIGAGNLDNHSNQNDIPQWCDPIVFMIPPYNKHYLCFANHGIWDHCSLRTDQILKLKPKNFFWTCEIDF